jgi:hypothetical protein
VSRRHVGGPGEAGLFVVYMYWSLLHSLGGGRSMGVAWPPLVPPRSASARGPPSPARTSAWHAEFGQPLGRGEAERARPRLTGGGASMAPDRSVTTPPRLP